MSDIRTLPNEPGSGPTIVLFPVPLSGGETGPDLVRDGVKHAAFCKLGSIPNFTVQNGNWWLSMDFEVEAWCFQIKC